MVNIWKVGQSNRFGNRANHAAAHTLPSTHDVRPECADVRQVEASQAEWEKAIYARLNAKLLALSQAQNEANPDSLHNGILDDIKEVYDV